VVPVIVAAKLGGLLGQVGSRGSLGFAKSDREIKCAAALAAVGPVDAMEHMSVDYQDIARMPLRLQSTDAKKMVPKWSSGPDRIGKPGAGANPNSAATNRRELFAAVS
jgi:hypothetical protein